MYRYETNWATVRETRIRLVELANAGDRTALMVLREMTRRGLLFSIYAVNNPVDLQEAYYANAVAGRPILAGVLNADGRQRKGALGMHVRAVASVDAWMRDHFSLELFEDLTGHVFAQAAAKCAGLKWAKGMYAAGVLGFDNAGCIDTHMARQHGVDVVKLKTWKGYLTAYATTGWQTTLDQWADFLTVAAFALNQHDVWFRSVLATRAVVA